MVRVEEGSNEALRDVVAHIRDADVDEFRAINFVNDRLELQQLLIERYRSRDDTFAAFWDDTPVAFGAMIETRPNVITCGFFATDEFSPVAGRVARFIRRSLFPTYRDAGVHRIECTALARYRETCRFIELLGLRKEALLEGYGKRGEAFNQYAWVA